MSMFLLPPSHTHTADLVAADDAHLERIAASLRHQLADAEARRAAARARPVGIGQAALERDLDIHHHTARIRMLGRFRTDVCLGRMVHEDGATTYVGRTGLTDDAGEVLLVDWRSPAAEPFFAATPADPRGLTSRRRFRWSGSRVVDFWDEAFTADVAGLALDDDSAFIATLAAGRSPRMRDVLGTIAADQDTAIRASSHGALVVDGGPGTGKTVVALHRAAYLLYADPRLGAGRGGILFVGPHRPYLTYVSDVLPSLGEEGVRTVTLRDLVAEGEGAATEADGTLAALKRDTRMVDAVERAVAAHEVPPSDRAMVETPWRTVRIDRDDWAEAFSARDTAAAHNAARDDVWEALVEIIADRVPDAPLAHVRAAAAADRGFARTFADAWPRLEASDLIAHLWSAPRFLRWCAPWLTADEAARLQRADPRAWTDDDLPLLDAARLLLGDPAVARVLRERERQIAAERAYRADIADYLVAVDYDFEANATILLGQDAQNSLDDEDALPQVSQDELAGPFAHIVVDEAQELTPAQWRMLLRRCPSGSFTIVGDRAQARAGFAERWEERLTAVGLRDVHRVSLTVNYRTPAEIMAEAAPMIRAAIPDANVPTSIRASGVPVRRTARADVVRVVDDWLAAHEDGIACVIGEPSFAERPRVRSLSPILAKGLEFDLVVLVGPASFGEGVAGAVDRYVAMTRATGELVLAE